jgi:hypothetical protein
MNNFWGPADDEPLPDWMDPVKCRQVNEQKEMRKKTGGDLMSIIEQTLKQPPVPQVPDRPNEIK